MKFGHVIRIAVLTFATAAFGQSSPSVLILHLTPQDGQLLVQEALDKGSKNGFSMHLLPNGAGFAVKEERLILNAEAAYQGMSCTIHLEGIPAITSNKLNVRDPKITTDGAVCNLALSLFEPRIKQSLDAHPWDLAKRLSRATVDSSLAGPRLPAQLGCIREDQITIRDANSRDNELQVEIAITSRSAATSCP